MQPAPVTYRPRKGNSQTTHLDGMPIGTLGGMFARHNFPLDAEYEIHAAGTRVDLTIDGVPIPTPAADRFARRYGPDRTRSAPRAPGHSTPETWTASSARLAAAAGESRASPSPDLTACSRPGDTPSRRKIFVCYPANQNAEASCARQIVRTLATRAFRQPITDKDPSIETLLRFYQEGRNEGGFEIGIQRALARVLVDPQFIFRMEHVPANLPPGRRLSA